MGYTLPQGSQGPQNNYNYPVPHKVIKAKNHDIAAGVLGIIAAVGATIAIPIVAGVGFGTLGEGFLLAGLIDYACVYNAVHSFGRISRYNKFAKVLGGHRRFKLAALSNATGIERREVAVSLNEMIRKRYFDWAAIDEETGELILDPTSAPMLTTSADDYNGMRLVPRTRLRWTPPVLSAAIAATWGATFFQSGWAAAPEIIIALPLIFALTLLALNRAAPREKFYVEAYVAPKPIAVLKTGVTEADELLRTISRHYDELRRLSGVMETNTPIHKNILAIIKTLGEIIKQAGQSPDTVKTLREFANYYLPTAVKLFGTHEELRHKSEKTPNITIAMKKIEDASAQIQAVVRKHYNDLFSDKVMDISAEVAVMENMIGGTAGGDDPFGFDKI